MLPRPPFPEATFDVAAIDNIMVELQAGLGADVAFSLCRLISWLSHVITVDLAHATMRVIDVTT